ncbi:MAG: NAD(P)-binding protein [Gemmatimonadales bacterium]|jgi:predicted NAD/FAD-binding protein
MRIAVIGTGISGLATAWLLNRRHEVHVFEKQPRVGGHSPTVVVERAGRRLPLDTGFIVFNRTNYPYLTKLFDVLSVPSQETDMSFAVRCDRCDFEYNGGNLAGLFAQKRNFARPGFYRMLFDIARFGVMGRKQLARGAISGLNLGQYLSQMPFGQNFSRHYLIPMAAALWSSGTRVVDGFPAESLLRFFDNHGLLRLRDRFPWRTVVRRCDELLAPHGLAVIQVPFSRAGRRRSKPGLRRPLSAALGILPRRLRGGVRGAVHQRPTDGVDACG